MHGNDSVKRTIVVATLLCLICSIMVSVAAVKLKPYQDQNKVYDIRKNLLMAAGLATNQSTRSEVEEAYKQVTAHLVNLKTGEMLDDATFDVKTALKSSSTSRIIPKDQDKAGIIYQANQARIYTVTTDGAISHYIFPVYGKGLWSTMYGFFVLGPDFKTVKGIGFYEHGETPGLGGEIDNQKWKDSWKEKIAYDDQLNVVMTVLKGQVDASNPASVHQVDGLSGATLTSKGVHNMIQFWLGEQGFLPFIKGQLAKGAQ